MLAQTIGKEQVFLCSRWRTQGWSVIGSVSDRLTDGSSLGIINHLLVQDVEYGMTVSVKIPAEGFCVRHRGEDLSPLERRGRTL